MISCLRLRTVGAWTAFLVVAGLAAWPEPAAARGRVPARPLVVRPATPPPRVPPPVVTPRSPTAGGPRSVLQQHHTYPRAMMPGGGLPYGARGLTPLSPANHRAVHQAMRSYFDQSRFWRADAAGRRVNIYPRGNQPRGSSVRNFDAKTRYRALDGFYRQYQGGKLLDNFRREAELAARARKLK